MGDNENATKRQLRGTDEELEYSVKGYNQVRGSQDWTTKGHNPRDQEHTRSKLESRVRGSGAGRSGGQVPKGPRHRQSLR